MARQGLEHGAEEGGRRRVHVVRVVDQQHRGRAQRRLEEPDHRAVQAVGAEGARELRHGGRVVQLEPERDGEQRQPRLQVGRALADGAAQAAQHRLRRVLPAGPDQGREQLAPRRVGARPAVRLARRQQGAQADGVVAHRVEQARLADARLARQLGEAAVAAPDRRQRRAQRGELGRPSHERLGGAGRLLGLPAGDRRADRPRLDGVELPLELERLEPGEREARGRPVQDVGRRVDLAGRRPAHQARGEVDHVAHRRVGAAVLRADVARERPAAVDADLHGQPPLALGDAAQRPQHPLLLVADGVRRAGAEDELAAVGVGVRAQQGDLVLLRRLLHVRDQLANRRGRGRQALALDPRVGAAEAHERDRDEPVLRCPPAAEHVSAHGHRQAEGQPTAVDLGRRLLGREVALARRGPQQPARPGRGAEAPARQQLGDGGADHDVAGARGALHAQHRRHGRAGDDRLAVRAAGEEQVQRAGVDADRHAQRRAGAGRGERAGGAQRAAHADRGAARALGVAVALEEQEQRVAAELQQAAAVRVGDLEQRGERAADRVADLLGALGADAGQPLGEPREARHVGEHQRARQRPHRGRRVVRELPDHRAREVGRQGPDGGRGRDVAPREHHRSLRPGGRRRHWMSDSIRPRVRPARTRTRRSRPARGRAARACRAGWRRGS